MCVKAPVVLEVLEAIDIQHPYGCNGSWVLANRPVDLVHNPEAAHPGITEELPTADLWHTRVALRNCPQLGCDTGCSIPLNERMLRKGDAR